MDCKTPKLLDEDSTTQGREHSMGDRLSSLPDEILLRILGFSPMRDAVATGLLSRRWRNLWKSGSTFKLDPLSQHGVYKRDSVTQKKNVKQWRMKTYAYWVDCVIGQLHQLKSLEEFWICSDFCAKLAGDAYLEPWLSFALERKVRKLNINLSDDEGYCNLWKRCAFPPPYLREEKASSVIQLCLKGVEVPSSPGFSIFSSLTSLTLSWVTLSDDFCETAFSNCLLLEHLHLWSVYNLVSLKLVGSSLSLRHLELYHCDKLNDVDIYAPNLVSFTYVTAVKTRIAFESVPKLVKACFRARYVGFHWKKEALKNNISYSFDQLDCISTQLESLVLGMNAMEAEARSPVLCPTFMSLKTLALFVDTIDDIMKCIGLPCLLVEACPMLQKFELHQSRTNDVVELESSERLKASLSTHRFLKEIVLSGFLGQSYDMALLEYLIKTAVSLEKLTIITYAEGLHKGEAVKYCYNSKSEEEIQNAREVAKKLCMELLPDMAQVIIL